jgi:hypothetical protein
VAKVSPALDVGECIMGLEMIAIRVSKMIRSCNNTWTEMYAIISGVTSFIPWSSELDECAAVRCPVKADEGPMYTDCIAYKCVQKSSTITQTTKMHPYKYMPTK